MDIDPFGAGADPFRKIEPINWTEKANLFERKIALPNAAQASSAESLTLSEEALAELAVKRELTAASTTMSELAVANLGTTALRLGAVALGAYVLYNLFLKK